MAQIVMVAGVDVSKHWLDAALWPKRDALRVEASASGYDQLAAWLREHNVDRVGLEASGGYEIAVIDALEARGFEVVRFNAHRVRLFAKAKGRLAKNDRADAAPSHRPRLCWLRPRRNRAGSSSIRWSSCSTTGASCATGSLIAPTSSNT
jgi:hypothetical protein